MQINPVQTAQAVPTEAQLKDAAKIRELAQEFEAIFLELMLNKMRESVPKNELLNGGNGEEIFRSMLDSEYAKIMAGQGTGGISDMIAKELLKSMQIPSDSINLLRGSKAYEAAQLRVGKNRATID